MPSINFRLPGSVNDTCLQIPEATIRGADLRALIAERMRAPDLSQIVLYLGRLRQQPEGTDVLIEDGTVVKAYSIVTVFRVSRPADAIVPAQRGNAGPRGRTRVVVGSSRGGAQLSTGISIGDPLTDMGGPKTEEDRIKALRTAITDEIGEVAQMRSAPTWARQQWQHTGAPGRGAKDGSDEMFNIGQGGVAPRGYGGAAGDRRTPPPQGYVCYNCGCAGHYIQDCPMPRNNRGGISVPAGIQESMLEECSPEDPDRMVTRDGRFVKRKMVNIAGTMPNLTKEDAVKTEEFSSKKQILSDDTKMIPERLQCPVCKRAFEKPVKTPCCGYTCCGVCLEKKVRHSVETNDAPECPGCEDIIIVDEAEELQDLAEEVRKWKSSLSYTSKRKRSEEEDVNYIDKTEKKYI